MKTIRQHLETLPEPFRREALESLETRGNNKIETLDDALKSAFTWVKTPQGHEYWSELVKKINPNKK